jgi:hypothetical protein
MKRTLALAGLSFLLSSAGCSVVNSDAGPTQTTNEDIDAGKAETVRAEIHMSGGELHLQGGAAKLMTGSFRYSERVGRPDVRYEVAGSRGQLTVQSPNQGTVGKAVNEWTLRMGSEPPLEFERESGRWHGES